MEQIVQSTEQTNYVVCLKWGDKYSPEYVNKLNNMVERNLTLPYKFVCFTENNDGIDKSITTEKLPKKLQVSGWWYKPWFFSNEIGLKGTILFLDLDLIVFRNIDKLFTYQPNKFCIIQDFNRKFHRNYTRVNSSVFRISSGEFSDHYEDFVLNRQRYLTRYKGDQDWIYAKIPKHTFWPEEWIQSYKWEMRGRQYLTLKNGVRNFTEPGIPNVLPETSIAVFHGQPNMDQCIDNWPKQNWY